ncbi:hypothetical protein DFH08DRAFT_815028 [Mycena albidolilacea]|uniref:Uncharacterized protein n=1 Tax=Mycena albidolilacea TaxID=1033008 RepID=A0AAD7EK47_9AGAR|nr:hypothetical protein DFH08DRAFT_815028 [Mycena albidolilacea]
MSGSPRSLRNMRNTGQGTAFHELVVPGQNIGAIDGPLALHTFVSSSNCFLPAPPVTLAGSAPQSPEESEDLEPARLFYVHVTLEWTENTKSGRNSTRPKKMHEAKLVSTPVDVLSLSRIAFVPIALSAHAYNDLYIAGVASGPAMHIFWTGSPGGKGGAAVVRFDADWNIIVQKLRKASKKLDTISVVFNLDMMEGFKQRSKRIHSPDPYESELSYGTRVPNTANYTPVQIAVAGAIDEIKAAHSCKEHGTCFIDANLDHLEMNRFCLSMWGQAVIAGKCIAGDPPPKELLSSWTGSTSSQSMSKPRGRSGPYPSQSSAGSSSAAADTTNLILTTMVPVMAMMARNMASNVSTSVAVAPPPVPRSPVQASSPPPAIEDDLDVFMDAFRRAKNIPTALIDVAKGHLHGACFTPDILSEPSVTVE